MQERRMKAVESSEYVLADLRLSCNGFGHGPRWRPQAGAPGSLNHTPPAQRETNMPVINGSTLEAGNVEGAAHGATIS
jgi:hypothetical protein